MSGFQAFGGEKHQGPGLVLASASSRRLELLARIGVTPARVVAAAVDEVPLPGENPARLAGRLADAKAGLVAAEFPDHFVLGADTVVACGRRILAKAESEEEAGRMLALLSGRRHRVISGVTLFAPGGKNVRRLVTTSVTFKRLERSEISAYLASGEWRDKAGAYAIQGRAAAFVKRLNGSYSNVVGLPLFEVCQMLNGLGFAGIRDC
jgi:septum formation protein